VHFVQVILVGHNLKLPNRSYVVTLDLQTIFSTRVDKQLPSGLRSSVKFQRSDGLIYTAVGAFLQLRESRFLPRAFKYTIQYVTQTDDRGSRS
jgi:hypothetical protein